MACTMNRDMLQDYAEGGMQGLEKLLVEQHIRTCRECRQELNQLKLLLWDLESLKEEDMPLPEEINAVRERTVSVILGENENRGTLVRYFRQQRRIAANAAGFVRYLPGAGLVTAAARKTPGLLGKAALGLFKGGLRILRRASQ